MRALNLVIVAVGSNIEPNKNIAQALYFLQEEQHLLGCSSFIWTKPEGYTDQADFLNGAVLIETALDPTALRAYLKALEHRLKRVKGPIKAGPRTLDLDIVIWNGEVMDTDFYHKSYIREPVLDIVRLCQHAKFLLQQ